MSTVDENEVCRSLNFAREMHATQKRKGTDAPYVTHLENVGRLLSTAGCNTDTVVAGILHDIVEDTPTTFDEVQQRFGKQVMELVAAASEQDKSLSWKQRKEIYLRMLENAPVAQLFVPCADKLDNISFLLIMLRERGREYLSNFNAPECELAWFYLSAAEIFATRLKKSVMADMAAELLEKTKIAFPAQEYDSGEQ